MPSELHDQAVQDDARGPSVAVAEGMDVDEVVVMPRRQVVRVERDTALRPLNVFVQVLDPGGHVGGHGARMNEPGDLFLAGFRVDVLGGNRVVRTAVLARDDIVISHAGVKDAMDGLDCVLGPRHPGEHDVVDRPREGPGVLDDFAPDTNGGGLVHLLVALLKVL